MPLKLTDGQIEILCRDLIARHHAPLSVRALRRALRERFGACGRTERVFAIWRRLTRPDTPSTHVTDDERQHWQARLTTAEQRARLAEERETAHQDRWASEVVELRTQLRERQGRVPIAGVSHEAYHRIHAELLRTQNELAQLRAPAKDAL